MLGRQVGTSLLRLPRCARLPIRSLPLRQQQQHDLALRLLAPSLHRAYAEVAVRRPGRPKKAVGEPSRPVKRAVKRAAKSPKEDAATKQVKARKETAKKKKKAAAKPKKKALTEEQKARQASRLAKQKERLAKADISDLKKLALDPPPVLKSSPWVQFCKERFKLKDHVTPGQPRTEGFGQRQKELRDEYKNITPAEQEHYNHLSHTARDNELAAYKKYVESHTIDEIEAANRARASLRRKLKDSPAQVKKWPTIKDERAVKHPLSSFAQFTMNRHASGDFKHMRIADASKLIGQEWKALSAEEKKKYDSLFRTDRERYTEEYTGVHGHAPRFVMEGQQPAQAAAAAA